MPEPLTTIVYLAAFLFLMKYKNRHTRKWLLLCGCCTGLALIVRPDAPFFILGISIGVLILLYKKYRNKKKLWPIAREGFIFLAPLILFFAIYAYYNYARFGDIFELGYATKAQEVTKSEGEGRAFRIKSFGGTLQGFAGMWIIPCRSIFFINPVLFFVFWALKDFWKKFRFEFIILGIIFILYVLLYSNRGPEGFPGSSAWGVRYMVPVISFMVIVMGIFVEKIIKKGNILLKIFIAIFALSVVLQCIGVSNSYIHIQSYLEEHVIRDDKWQVRRMMNMNPRWNLITENIMRIQRGNFDLLYINYMFHKDVLSDGYLQAKWVGIAPWLLVCTLFTSGYMLLKTLKRPTAEPLRKGLTPRTKNKHKAH
jgi:hypothetical protein